MGSVYVTGEIEGTSMVVGSDTLLNPQGGNGPTVMFLIRYDLNGNAIWAIQSGTAATVSSFACSAFLNHIWVSGPMPYLSPITFGSYTINPYVNPQDATTYIVRFDSTGTATYGQGLGGGGDDYFGVSVYDSCHAYVSGDLGEPTSFGNYYLTYPGGGEFAFVAKLSFPCSNIDGVDEQPPQNNSIVLYPNPNSGTFVLKNEGNWENQEIYLMNSIGQEVYRQKISGNTSEINSKLKSGLYFYKLLQSNKTVLTGKLIVD
jgi:hypothetical protein